MSKIEAFRTDALPAELPFSAALRGAGLVFTSGQIGNVPGEMRLVEGGLKAEAQQALEHLRSALEAAGSSLDRVLKCTVFFADMQDFQPFNDIYREFFNGHLPARSGIEVKGLALGARVEIECIALAGSD
ncbi:RidA family protein [Pelagibius litoralis]|uniref:RidA family protein n=1 Tax=Pelagibius litoralis TaxID=374515 RepID=A0A967CBM4_9PROT|nr:Rid family detoxifying hydrolase [Pelagibius litoralis]NIA68458.1 RidA family protein [Pelagibius litoralis]